MTAMAVLLATASILALAAAAPAGGAQVGAAAPPFVADSSAGPVRLADFQGKKNVLLAFYYADFTGG